MLNSTSSVSVGKTIWGKEENILLQEEFVNLNVKILNESEISDPLSSISLKIEETSKFPKKTVEEIKHQIRRLRLHKDIKFIKTPNSEVLISLIKKAIDLNLLDALKWISEVLNSKRFILIPVDDMHFVYLENDLIKLILNQIGFEKGTNDAYWKLPLHIDPREDLFFDLDDLVSQAWSSENKNYLNEMDVTDNNNNYDELINKLKKMIPSNTQLFPYNEKLDIIF